MATINGSVVQFQQAQTLIFSLQTQREQLTADLSIREKELTQLRTEYEQRQIAEEEREDEEKSILLVENDSLRRERDEFAAELERVRIEVMQLQERETVKDKEIEELKELSQINQELAQQSELRVDSQANN